MKNLRWAIQTEGTVRLAFQNINGFGFDKAQVKYQRIFNFLKNYKIDKFGLAESNIYWPKINVKHRLWDKTKGWFEGLSINMAYNTEDSNIT